MAVVAFYILAAIVTISAVGVIASRNPVHSVLFLILSFFTAAGLLVLIGAEFLAMLIVVVYVGAVAVLFLFVVMMLDVDFAELKQGTLRYWPFAIMIGVAFFAMIALVGASRDETTLRTEYVPGKDGQDVTNAEAIGNVMYTDNLLLFQLAGIVLLIAMIGAIVLTLRQRPGVRKQNIAKQTARKREDAVEAVDVTPGQGI